MRQDTIRQKLVLMKQYLGELDTLSRCSQEEYLSDFKTRRACERLIQVIVECMIDCNHALIAGMGTCPPATYTDSILKLVDESIMSQDFASRLIPYVSIRNRIVHEYEQIKDNLIFATLRLFIKDMNQYSQTITNYIKSAKG
jgi:uncharacterized protein YutE (UPF0331/DUF86 family)